MFCGRSRMSSMKRIYVHNWGSLPLFLSTISRHKYDLVMQCLAPLPRSKKVLCAVIDWRRSRVSPVSPQY